MSKQTDLVIKFRTEFDKRINETIQSYLKRRDEAMEKSKDDPVRKVAVKDWWDNRIDALRWSQTVAMTTESSIIADILNEELDEFKQAFAK